MTPPEGRDGPVSPQCSSCDPVWLLGAERAALCSFAPTSLRARRGSFSHPFLTLFQWSYCFYVCNFIKIIIYPNPFFRRRRGRSGNEDEKHRCKRPVPRKIDRPWHGPAHLPHSWYPSEAQRSPPLKARAPPPQTCRNTGPSSSVCLLIWLR